MSRSSRAGALAALALLACACGTSNASRVAVDRDQTDIVFGFTKATPKAAALVTPPPASDDDGGIDIFTPSPIKTFAPSFGGGSACPTAEPTEPVSGSAGTEIVGRPKPGTYGWVGSGSYDMQGAKLPVPTSFEHYVRSVESYDDPVRTNDTGDAFTYQTIDPRIGGASSGYWLYSWQVKTFAPSSDPESGLVLTRIDQLTPDGKVVDTYFDAFTSGVLFVPFPIKAGQTWNATSVDLGRRTLQLEGQVLRREVVDACGELIQGWHVHATLTEPGATTTLDYLVGTQFGGQLLTFDINGSYLGTKFDPAKFHIGKLEPSPLPKEFKG
jgi:hypothetical protein